MPGEEVKLNIWMPLDIGPFLQDTALLNTEETGAYILLLLYYWAHGPLPNEPERLANIARMPLDAWSIAFASLSMYFILGNDGLLHQKGADRRRAQWIDKRLKAREKAIKAANARWGKHKAKKSSESNAPSITQAMHEECPLSVIQVQKQKQNTDPLAPSAAADGASNAPSIADAPSIPDQADASSMAGAPSMAGSVAGAVAAEESVKKAKTHPDGRRALRNSQDDGIVQPGRENARAPHSNARMAGKNSQIRPSKTEILRKKVKGEVLAYWRGQNPKGPDLLFSRADNRALNDLLREHQEWTLAGIQRLLRNRAGSEVNPSASPHKWLRNIGEYASGPLDKFGKLKAQGQMRRL